MGRIAENVRRYALEVGFDACAIGPAGPAPHLEAYLRWIGRGYHAGMTYMARPDRIARRRDPKLILAGARSIISVALNYYVPPPGGDDLLDPGMGYFSMYAWGRDYHDVMGDMLRRLAAMIERAYPGARTKAYVDTGAILERDHAAMAGMGFIGKSTALILPGRGPHFFLGEVLTDLELEPDSPDVRGGCGSCSRCIEACPTGALISPYVLDARRCISYLTIEHKGPIPLEMRPLLGNRVYGCDVCVDVCPWGRFASPTHIREFHPPSPDRIAMPIPALLRMDEAEFERRYAGTPVHRIGRDRLIRNACVAAGNWGNRDALPALRRLLGDANPIIREHARWALDMIEGG